MSAAGGRWGGHGLPYLCILFGLLAACDPALYWDAGGGRADLRCEGKAPDYCETTFGPGYLCDSGLAKTLPWRETVAVSGSRTLYGVTIEGTATFSVDVPAEALEGPHRRGNAYRTGVVP